MFIEFMFLGVRISDELGFCTTWPTVIPSLLLVLKTHAFRLMMRLVSYFSSPFY